MLGLIIRPPARSQQDTMVDAWGLVNQGPGAMATDERGVHRCADPSTR